MDLLLDLVLLCGGDRSCLELRELRPERSSDRRRRTVRCSSDTCDDRSRDDRSRVDRSLECRCDCSLDQFVEESRETLRVRRILASSSASFLTLNLVILILPRACRHHDLQGEASWIIRYLSHQGLPGPRL